VSCDCETLVNNTLSYKPSIFPLFKLLFPYELCPPLYIFVLFWYLVSASFVLSICISIYCYDFVSFAFVMSNSKIGGSLRAETPSDASKWYVLAHTFLVCLWLAFGLRFSIDTCDLGKMVIVNRRNFGFKQENKLRSGWLTIRMQLGSSN